ncbi:uncharacterized protein XM38_012060 [Halomicronema hongdechloris C2206]|uniref:DUF4278 domain-containing protein n=1 Tax=Halomicronema hongdechloris C2206 TaxID=1641165 RepID=A0A1Z3HIX2_9CYAN|nr:DUF4278 domain-containing protein [Halomicronema hongdechloris]ASC70269.1 uncharacterized protein XM38_012060 [Halomicronema hongdechloris C2206]
MQLSYRGAHYEATIPNLEADNIEEIGRYRGATMTRKHFKVAQPHHGRVELTYRGVKYSHEV